MGIRLMMDISNSFTHKEKEYLLFFSLGEEGDSLVITITEGLNYLWAKELDMGDFDQIRKDLGLEGSFENFFQLFKDAILQLSGNFKIDIKPSNLDLDFDVQYKISKTAILTGKINIGTPLLFEQDKTMFRQFIKKTMFDLQTAKKKESIKLEKELFELKERLKITEEKLAQAQKSLPAVDDNIQNNEAAQNDAKKKKANSSLINPNLKKRKGMGAKLG